MFHYQPNKIIRQVVIVGVGGTGGRLVPLVTQLLTTTPLTKRAKVILMDGDIVEEKNCKRQLFIPSEVGKNKADVMASRYNRAFGANTLSIPSFFPLGYKHYTGGMHKLFLKTPEELQGIQDLLLSLMCRDSAEYQEVKLQLSTMNDEQKINLLIPWVEKLVVSMKAGLTVFVLAVDSVEARQSLMTFIQELAAYRFTSSSEAGSSTSLAANIVVIDGGNEDVFGQVNYFNPVTIDLCPFNDVHSISDRGYFSMPTALVPFPSGRYLNMVEGVSERRCGDVDQTLSVNNMVASMMSLVFHNLFYNLPMNFHKICFNLNGAMSTEYMTNQWMKGVITSDKQYQAGLLSKDYSSDMVLGSKAFKDLSTDDKRLFGVWRNQERLVSGSVCEDYMVNAAPASCRSTMSVSSRNQTVLTNSDSLKGYFMLSRNTNFLSCSWSEIVIPLMYEGYRRGQVTKEVFFPLIAKMIFLDSSPSWMGWRAVFENGDCMRNAHNLHKLMSESAVTNRSQYLVLGTSCVSKAIFMRPGYNRNDTDTFNFSTGELLKSSLADTNEVLLAICNDGTNVVAGSCVDLYMTNKDCMRFTASYVLISNVISSLANNPSLNNGYSYFMEQLVKVIRTSRTGHNVVPRRLEAMTMFLADMSGHSGANETGERASVIPLYIQNENRGISETVSSGHCGYYVYGENYMAFSYPGRILSYSGRVNCSPITSEIQRKLNLAKLLLAADLSPIAVQEEEPEEVIPNPEAPEEASIPEEYDEGDREYDEGDLEYEEWR